jgi:PAS domain S-box-containing protein
MRHISLSIGAKIILLNGVILLLMAGSLLHIFTELGKANEVIQEQKKIMRQLETVSNAANAFSQLRYWMTDLALSWQNDAEDHAMENKTQLDNLFRILEKENPSLVTELAPKVESFTNKFMSSVDAYIDGNRVLGNAMVSAGRNEAHFIEEELNKLVYASELRVEKAGEKLVAANADIRNLSLALIIIATALSAVFSLFFSRNMTRRLQTLMAPMKAIAGGDLKQETLAIESKDEIGQLTLAYNEMASSMQHMAQQADDIAKGQFEAEYGLKGDLAIAFEQMKEELKNKKNYEIREKHLVIDLLEQEKREARERQKGENKIKSILDNAMDGIITIDDHGIVQSFNLAAESIFGYSFNDVIGKNINQLMPEPDKTQHDEYLHRYLSGGLPKILGVTREVIAQRKDGVIFPLELSVSKVPHGDTLEFIGIVRDIGERTRMRNELEQFNADLENSNEILQFEVLDHEKTVEKLKIAKGAAESANSAKSMFLANMSHEIRTPMNAVFGYSQILQRDKTLNTEQKRAVNNILNSGQHLLELINDILDISKIEAGRIKLTTKDFSLNNLIDDLSIIFKLRCDEKNISWNINRFDNDSNWVNGDAAKVKQILINLLGNAVKFIQAGEISLNLKNVSKDIICFDVIDTGPGIPIEFQENIFEPFRQSEEGIKKGGTGLGLAISKKQAELMEGSLTLHSKVGEGSRFTLSLPLPTAKASPTEEFNRNKKIIHLAKGQSLKALVVEDLELNREVLTKLLMDIGIDVVEALNGQEGCEKAHEYKPDIIFMDIRMPVMGGFEAINIIRKDFSSEQMKIVIVTASALAHEQEDYERKADSFIFKPFQSEEIFECLYKFFDLEFEYEEDNKEVESEILMTSSSIDFSNTQLSLNTFQSLLLAAKSGNVSRFEKILKELEPTIESDKFIIKQLLAISQAYDLKKAGKILKEFLDD